MVIAYIYELYVIIATPYTKLTSKKYERTFGQNQTNFQTFFNHRNLFHSDIYIFALSIIY